MSGDALRAVAAQIERGQGVFRDGHATIEAIESLPRSYLFRFAVWLQDEDLSRDVWICPYLRQEAHHAAAGQLLDGLAEALLHCFLEGVAGRLNLAEPAGVDQRALGLGVDVLQDAQEVVLLHDCSTLRRTATVELAMQADDGIRDRQKCLAAIRRSGSANDPLAASRNVGPGRKEARQPTSRGSPPKIHRRD
jgi:hypothetical protein